MAEKKYVQKPIKIPKAYTRAEREAIGFEIVNYIRERTASGYDKDERKFKGYSETYTKSLDFKIAGKSKGDINLRLSGDMMAVLDVVKNKPGEIVIGFDPGAPEADRAEGNIRGTYGQSRGSKEKARNFLGIKPDVLKSILEKFPLDDKQALKEATQEALEMKAAFEDTEAEDG